MVLELEYKERPLSNKEQTLGLIQVEVRMESLTFLQLSFPFLDCRHLQIETFAAQIEEMGKMSRLRVFSVEKLGEDDLLRLERRSQKEKPTNPYPKRHLREARMKERCPREDE